MGMGVPSFWIPINSMDRYWVPQWRNCNHPYQIVYQILGYRIFKLRLFYPDFASRTLDNTGHAAGLHAVPDAENTEIWNQVTSWILLAAPEFRYTCITIYMRVYNSTSRKKIEPSCHRSLEARRRWNRAGKAQARASQRRCHPGDMQDVDSAWFSMIRKPHADVITRRDLTALRIIVDSVHQCTMIPYISKSREWLRKECFMKFIEIHDHLRRIATPSKS